jgi:phage N-6-adenine-methyltransferase
MKNKNLKNNDNWQTPKEFYDKLNLEFNFDFDPCPLNKNEIKPENNGLLIDWGQRNYINPPYSIKLKKAFVLKALEESRKGKLCVLLLPVSTSTKLFHEIIKPNANEIRFIQGRIKFIGINTKGQLVNNKSPMHDSMIVVFGNKNK